MNIQTIVQNELHQESSSVWLLRGHEKFAYSDGAASERYLKKVFLSAKDLSAGSTELEGYIKDWSSEYHLTTKRAQLLSGFKFDRKLKVLEVGCGCGAISRFLGETFENVISIEGSIARARLASLRTRDLGSVSIICAPFQEIRFTEKFDLIFVIGVFEYSASFVSGDDPYEAVLSYFSDMLTPDGMVILAIENQFGLKYWNGCREDHLGIKFEGLEGYHHGTKNVRTFGKAELQNYVERYFPNIQFYYPYPDYKIPDCVLSDEFLKSGSGGELVSQLPSRDYSGFYRPSFDEAATVLELSRNRALDFFSNSYLLLASKGEPRGVSFDQLGCLYSPGRKPEFRTETRIVAEPDGKWTVSKRLRGGGGAVEQGPVRLVATASQWIPNQSLLTHVMLRSKGNGLTLKEIFAPCQKWVKLLASESRVSNGVAVLDGARIDCLWSNVYFDRNELRVVDQEWIWTNDVKLNVVVIRAIYDFLRRVESEPRASRDVIAGSGRDVITRIAAAIGVSLEPDDFDDFIALESEFQYIVAGANPLQMRMHWRLFTIEMAVSRFAVRSVRSLFRNRERAKSLFGRVISKTLLR
jgi:SAM-dependent methyltransferase